MKHKLLLLAASLAVSAASVAAEWTKPVYSGAFQPLAVGDTVYLYNADTQLFYTEGNDWGTHASVGETGLLITLQKYLIPAEDEDGEPAWDGKTLEFHNFSVVKNSWKLLFAEMSGEMWVDRASQGDYLFEFEAAGTNRYHFFASDLNPDVKHNADWGTGNSYVTVDPEYIYHAIDNGGEQEQTGTGVRYLDITQITAPQYTWAFVSREDYAVYQEQVACYTLAMRLGELIDQILDLDGDATALQAIYDNPASTSAELEAAVAEAELLVVKLLESQVSPENPVDETFRIQNPGFEDGIDGWTNEAGFGTFEAGTWGGMIDGEHFTGSRYLNLYHDEAITGRALQTITGLPAGVYELTVAAYTNTSGAYVFAGDFKTPVEVRSATPGDTYTVTALVTDGTLDIGYYAEHPSAFWSTVDNFRLQFFGNGEEAYTYWVDKSIEQAPTFDDVYCQKALLETYRAALDDLTKADLDESIMTYIRAYLEALAAVNTNVAAYNNLQVAISEAQEKMPEIYDTYAQQAEAYIRETAQKALEELTLGTDEVYAIAAQLRAIVAEGERTIPLFNQLNELNDQMASYIDQYASTCSPEALATAQALYAEVTQAILSGVFNANEEIEAYIARVEEAMYQLRIPAVEASDDNPVDYTVFIRNADFENGLDGWENEAELATFQHYARSTWSGLFNDEQISGSYYLNLWDSQPSGRVKQTITGIPNGTYTLTAGTYTNTEGASWLFAGADNAAIATETNWTEVTTVVTDGTLTFGVLCYSEEAFWTVVDNFSLICYGKDSVRERSGDAAAGIVPTGIEEMVDGRSVNGTCYDLSGRRVSAPAKKGLYIINGRKIIIR